MVLFLGFGSVVFDLIVGRAVALSSAEVFPDGARRFLAGSYITALAGTELSVAWMARIIIRQLQHVPLNWESWAVLAGFAFLDVGVALRWNFARGLAERSQEQKAGIQRQTVKEILATDGT